MLRKSSVLILLFFVVLSYLVNTTIPVLDSENNPVCTDSNGMTPSYTPIQDSNKVTYDAQSYFYDSVTGDSSRLFLKSGDGSNNFKFICFDTTLTKYEAQCDGTPGSGFSLVKLVNQVLFLRKTSSTAQFYVCKFDLTVAKSGQKMNSYKLNVDSDTFADLSDLLPIKVAKMSTDIKLFVLLLGSFPAIGSWTWSNVQLSKDPLLMYFEDTYTPTLVYDGNPQFLYDSNKFIKAVFGDIGYGDEWYLHDISATFSPGASDIVKFYTSQTPLVILSIMRSTKLAGQLYIIQDDQTPIAFDSATTVTPFVDYSDQTTNFLRVGDAKMIWIRVKFDGSYYKSIITVPGDISITGLQAVSLSGNKGVFLYSNKMEYYVHTQENRVSKIFQTSFTSTNMDLSSTSNQYKVSLNCLCNSIEKISCFASSLSCIILRWSVNVCSKSSISTS